MIGEAAAVTGRKHVPVHLYKMGEHLEKQYAQIESALENINAFNAGKKREEAQGTIKKKHQEWKKYYEGTQFVKIPIVDLNKLTIDEWAHKLIREHDMNSHLYYNVASILNQMLEYSIDLGIIEKNEYSRVKIQTKIFRPDKKKPSETQVYSKEETAAFKAMAWKDFEERRRKNHTTPLAAAFMFLTGIRISEVLVLRYEDIQGNYICINKMLRRDEGVIVNHTKGCSSDRLVPLVPEAWEIINACRELQEELGVESDGYIFSINGEHCSYYTVRDIYDSYCKRLGIITKSSHKARKTFISALYDGSVNPNTIREIAGHTDERTTQKSYCYDRRSRSERNELIAEALS